MVTWCHVTIQKRVTSSSIRHTIQDRCSFDFVEMWFDIKPKIFYLHLHKTSNHQTWQSCDIGSGAPTHQVTCPFDHVVTWCHVTKQKWITSNSIRLTIINKFRGCHLPSHMSFDHVVTWCHVAKQKYIYFHKTYNLQTR